MKRIAPASGVASRLGATLDPSLKVKSVLYKFAIA